MLPLVVTWRNFRGFQDSTRLRFPRVTVLIGRNNVGKTSAYAPLLLLRQTLDARNPQTALLSRGQLTDLGNFSDYASRHDTSQRVAFTIGLGEYDRRWSRPGVQPATMHLEFDSPDGHASRLWQYRITDAEDVPLVTRTRNPDGGFRVTSRLLPVARSVGRPFKEVTVLRRAMRQELPEGFLFSGVGSLLIPRTFREDRGRWEAVREWFNAANELYNLHQEANRRLEEILRGIVYVGPLRSLPQATYRLAAEPPSDVGRDGEFAPEVLYRLRDTEIKSQVDQWLETLGYGHLKFTELGGGEYFQVHIESSDGLAVNLAHTGIGLSQVLPLLVGGLMSRESSTFIAQQPEIHLNPAQQNLTMDFLLQVAKGGRRVIVETHSEHVLLRLRRRVAEGAISSSEVAVYYFDNRHGVTSIEQVPIGTKGEIEKDSWPEGFFEEQFRDSLAMALAQSRSES